MDKNIEVLQEVLDLLEEEKRRFYNLVSQNDFRIEEINSYLRELSKNEEDDFKVFSPRNVENKHREQIEADTFEKKKCEEENVEYNKKIESLKLLISKVSVVIDSLHIENSEKEQQIILNKEVVEENNNETPVIENNTDRADHNIDNSENKNDDIDCTGQKILDSQMSDVDISDENMDIQRMKQKFTSEKEHIAHQILNCVSFITPDEERAKIELTALAKKIIEY